MCEFVHSTNSIRGPKDGGTHYNLCTILVVRAFGPTSQYIGDFGGGRLGRGGPLASSLTFKIPALVGIRHHTCY